MHGSKSADAAKEVSKALREREPDAAKVAYASIVDLRPFAGLWKKVAEAQLKSSFAKLSERATAAGLDPNASVVICPDWDGSACNAFAVAEPDREPAALVVDAAGNVVAVVRGAAMAAAVLSNLGLAVT